MLGADIHNGLFDKDQPEPHEETTRQGARKMWHHLEDHEEATAGADAEAHLIFLGGRGCVGPRCLKGPKREIKSIGNKQSKNK